MIKNYLKTAIRSLLKNKLFSVINLSGLAIGMASFFAIMLYVGYEKSYDKFHENHKNIYRVYMDYTENGEYVPGDAQTYNLCGPTIKEEVPDVVDFVRFYSLAGTTLKTDNRIYETTRGYLADSSFFNVFTAQMINGNTTSALTEPNSIVLTESLARKIYGKTDVIGENIEAKNSMQKTSLRVTGIIKDIPENTHLKISYLVSFSTYTNWQVFTPQKLNWNNNCFFTYLLTEDGIKTGELRQKILNIDFGSESERMNIDPLTDIHLYSDKPYEAEANGNANSVKFLFAIAAFIILLSWLNFINLSSAIMMERTKEVGIRKVSGARKLQLVFQFISESFLLNFVAFSMAVGLTLAVLPLFNAFTGKELSFSVLSIGQTLVLTGIPVLGIFLSGLYPAIVLSSFAPIKVLKGKLTSARSEFSFKKGIVTVQFLATIILLIGTITILKQLKYLNNAPLGMNLDQTLSIKSTILDDTENADHSYQVLKEEIEKLSFVENVSLAQTFPGEGYEDVSTFSGLKFQNGSEDKHTNWFNYTVDENYISLMGFELLAGSNFSENAASRKNKIIINEFSSKLMGFTDFKDAIDKKVTFWGEDFYITGVIKNYHHFGLKNEEKPFVIRYSPDSRGLIVKLKSSNTASIAEVDKEIASLEKEWKKVFAKSTFQYTFIDQKFASLYNEEKKFSQSFTFFTILAIFIATLGLFGLSYYRINQRTKEIGIRKVNGARVSEVIAMLNRDFVKWVAIAFIIATPIAYYAMNKWLESFAYKTDLSWWIFALAGLLALGIALLTVSWQSWRAATRNPVEALRYE